MKADDVEGRVIYLSSFSKTLAPGFRVAWIDAPAALVAKFEMAKQAEDLCTGGLDQRVVYEASVRGILQRQIPRLREHYRAKRDVMVASLKQAFGAEVTWPSPRGGFFLWASLPTTIDTQQMIARAVQHGVIYVAGEAFFVNGAGRNIIRLSFSQPNAEQIREGVARLAATVQEELAGISPAGAGSAPGGRGAR